jgi:hypothetical protein
MDDLDTIKACIKRLIALEDQAEQGYVDREELAARIGQVRLALVAMPDRDLAPCACSICKEHRA